MIKLTQNTLNYKSSLLLHLGIGFAVSQIRALAQVYLLAR